MSTDHEMQRLLDDINRQQSEIERIQQEILNTEILGYGDQGMVTVTITGGGRFLDVRFDPDVTRYHDAFGLGAIVLDAINDAMGKLATLTREKYGPLMPDPSLLDQSITYWEPSERQV